MTKDLFKDVCEFSEKFGLPRPAKPGCLSWDVFNYRFQFLHEELREMADCQMIGDLAGFADAIADLVYVALGTAVMAGIPFQKVWDAVQEANMAKERATGPGDPRSTRSSGLDVVKPEGWTAPNIQAIIKEAQDGAE